MRGNNFLLSCIHVATNLLKVEFRLSYCAPRDTLSRANVNNLFSYLYFIILHDKYMSVIRWATHAENAIFANRPVKLLQNLPACLYRAHERRSVEQTSLRSSYSNIEKDASGLLAWYRPRSYTVSRCPEQTLWQRRATDRLVLSWPSHFRIWQRVPAHLDAVQEMHVCSLSPPSPLKRTTRARIFNVVLKSQKE